MQKTKFDWQFHAKTKTACRAGKNGCYWARGKMLGGTSALNHMVYVRGNKHDFDVWSDFGNMGWDYESVLPYFKKSEGNQFVPFVDYRNGRYHNGAGPLKVNFSATDGSESFQKLFYDAALERGKQGISDINADEVLGYVRLQGNYLDGRRDSTAKAFLVPAKNRPNLHIIKHAFVEKILINKENVAYGVKFTYKGKHKFKAFARKEVIVSAGTVMSPHLLMLSGIGPKRVLDHFKIPVKSDLAVGRHLLEHINTVVWLKFNPTETSPLQQFDSVYQYAMHQTGPLNSIGVTQLTGFINTANGTGNPDFLIHFFYFTKNSSAMGIFLEINDYRDSIKETFLNEIKSYDIAGVLVVKLHPKSQGYITLSSSSACDKPIIKPKYFSHSDDMETMLRAVKQQISYVDTNSYRNKGGQIMHIPVKNCDRHKFLSDEYLRCYIQYFSITTNHPVGSCKMGPNSDPDAVVDPRLRVRNIKHLREIDAGM